MPLFNEIVFGPIKSRRLGNSLGINLLPLNSKYCNFNCIYCECGWNTGYKISKKDFPSKENILIKLREKLLESDLVNTINTITFAGNGEPTLHPDFSNIIDEVIRFRNHHLPYAEVAVLSNGVLLKNPKIVQALMKVDKCILKLDAGTEELFQLINKPQGNLKLTNIITCFSHFKEKLIIQSLFLNGIVNGLDISNTQSHLVDVWIDKIKKIRPKQVMIYSLDRETPAKNLQKASLQEMTDIAIKLEQVGIDTVVVYNDE